MRLKEIIAEMKSGSDLWHGTTGPDSRIYAAAYDKCIKILEDAVEEANNLPPPKGYKRSDNA